jgi:error-prone DNA polymerase
MNPPITPPYAELGATTNFSFLRGGSHPEEMVAEAARLGHSGIGIADRNTLAGVVRAHVAARETGVAASGFRLVIGSRLVFSDDTPDILAYPRDRAGYGRLARLLSTGNLRAKKGDCRLMLDDLIRHAEGLSLIVMPYASPQGERPARLETVATLGTVLARLSPLESVRLGVTSLYGKEPRRRLAMLVEAARHLRRPLIALNDCLYHAPERRIVQDALTCIREGVTLEEAGSRLEAHAERHLKPGAEMARLFAAIPESIAETQRFLSEIRFSLDELRYDYPVEHRTGFADPQAALEAFAAEGAAGRYPGGVPEKVKQGLAKELALIGELKYAPYFLTVHEIVRFARSRGILCQGRGSAANSTVCFCLGITEVDPSRNDLLFERFISSERREPPDIDVDFEHERREEVMQYIYERYGRAHAGLAASVICYRSRSAIRESAKVFGLSEDMIAALSGTIWGWSTGALKEDEVRRIGLDPTDKALMQAMAVSRTLIGFPRHLSQHTGGFVITRTRLDEVSPLMNAAMQDRTTVEWDKDDLDALGILKIDVLALGMLSCLRRAFTFLAQHYGRSLTLSSIPAEDPRVYAMIQRADTIGVFQIESRAQMSMLPRLKPAKFYDLVIEVAIVRPGPIQGDMVHPYLRRREGKEAVVFPSPDAAHGPPDELEQVLGKTLGVPLFQEQAMRIAIVAAGFAPAEADRLRRAMATFRRVGTIHSFQTKMVDGMVSRGYDADFAARCFKQIEGFGEYGFPESHAASFALLVYASCWFKCRYPDVFAAALLNAQPMGFYATSQIVRDAQEHGVEVRPVDINHSDWDSTLEEGSASAPRLNRRHQAMAGDILSSKAIRLGLREIKGLSEEDGQKLMRQREEGYDSIRDLWLRGGLPREALERLAEADAFRSIGLDRREAAWVIKGLQRSGDKDDLPLLAAATAAEIEPDAHLPPMPLGEHVVHDYRHLSLSLKAHPVSFVRGLLDEKKTVPSVDLASVRTGRFVSVAGLVLVRQRPGTAKGVIFMTLEDETGTANVIVWPKVFETFRPIVLGSRFVAIHGRVQNEKGVIHVIAERVEDLTPMLGLLTGSTGAQIGRAALAPADHAMHPLPSKADQRASPAKQEAAAALLVEQPDLSRQKTMFAEISALARADEVRRPQRDHRDRRDGFREPERPPSSEPQTAQIHRILPKGRNFQ